MVFFKGNAAGKYQVGDRCIGCGICSEIAPQNFRSDHQQGYDYVYRQPGSDIEDRLCAEAMDICPVNAIADHEAGVPFNQAHR